MHWLILQAFGSSLCTEPAQEGTSLVAINTQGRQ